MRGFTTISWLKLASVIVMGFGIAVAMAAHPATEGVVILLADLIFWPLDGTQSLSTPETRLLCAVSGGIMTGWGVMLWLVATRLYPHDPELARMMIASSIGVWFVIDSLGSVIAGAPLNAVFNIGFLALFLVPLMLAPRLQSTKE